MSTVYTLSTESGAIHEQKDTVSDFVGKKFRFDQEGVLMGFFSFRKEEKKPFRIPREIADLRMRIETESRERYPSLASFQEITKKAELISHYLDSIISQKEHAEEAARIREDIRIKLDSLGKKIDANLQEAKKENKLDYVESNLDYLQRKSMRNNAKTVFTALLEAADFVERFARGDRVEPEKGIESLIEELFKIVSELNIKYFKVHGTDLEVQALKERTLRKLAEIDAAFQTHRSRFREHGLESIVESGLDKYRKK